MKKEDLLAMGLSEEQATQVMAALDGDYVTKSRFNEVNEAKNSLEAQLKERDRDLAKLSKDADGNQELQQRYTDLQSKYKVDMENLNQKLADMRLDHAIDMGLVKAKARNPKAVKALLDYSNLALDESGIVKGLDDQLEALRQSDGYQFEIEEVHTEGTGYEAGGNTNPLESFRTQFEQALNG